METVKETKEYTIYQKRSKRYAVKDPQKRWINGPKKVEILVKEKLLKVPVPKVEAKEEAAPEESESAEGKEQTEE